jgi:hypothetical protein
MSATAFETRMLKRLQHNLEYKLKPFSAEYFETYEQLTELLARVRDRG